MLMQQLKNGRCLRSQLKCLLFKEERVPSRALPHYTVCFCNSNWQNVQLFHFFLFCLFAYLFCFPNINEFKNLFRCAYIFSSLLTLIYAQEMSVERKEVCIYLLNTLPLPEAKLQIFISSLKPDSYIFQTLVLVMNLTLNYGDVFI